MLDESGEADDDVKRPGPDKRRNSDIASPLMSPLKVEEVKEGDSLHREEEEEVGWMRPAPLH